MMIYNQDKTSAVDPKTGTVVSLNECVVIDHRTVTIYTACSGMEVVMGRFQTERDGRPYFEELVKWVGAYPENEDGTAPFRCQILEFHQGADGKFKGEVTIYFDI